MFIRIVGKPPTPSSQTTGSETLNQQNSGQKHSILSVVSSKQIVSRGAASKHFSLTAESANQIP